MPTFCSGGSWGSEGPTACQGSRRMRAAEPTLGCGLASLWLPDGASDLGQEGPQVSPASPARLVSDPGLDAGVGGGPGVVRVLEELVVVGVAL